MRLAVERGFPDEGDSDPGETLLVGCAHCVIALASHTATRGGYPFGGTRYPLRQCHTAEARGERENGKMKSRSFSDRLWNRLILEMLVAIHPKPYGTATATSRSGILDSTRMGIFFVGVAP